MQILDLKNLQKNEGVIYYRRQYNADAEIELPNQIELLPVSFTIETGPLGNKEFELEFDSSKITYPLLPLKKALKDFILLKDSNGELPLWFLIQKLLKKQFN